MRGKPAAALLALLLAAAPLAAWGQEGAKAYARPDEGAILADLLLMRPLGLAAVAVGLVLYLPAALIQSIGGTPVEPLADALIRRPAEFTFKRPVGQINLD